MAAGCAALFLVVLVAAYEWAPTRSLDLNGLSGFIAADQGWRETLADWLVQFGDPPAVALIALALAGLAAARGRPRVALAVLLLIALTSVSSQLLKELLAHPRPQPGDLDFTLAPEAFPSGHATAAMSLALAAVLAAPRRARLAAALLGALLALAVGASLVAGASHFPSDVVGGYLLATGWALVLTAGLIEADRRFPATSRWAATAVGRALDRTAAGALAAAALGAAACTALLVVAAVGADPDGATAFVREHTTSVAVAAAVASAALALPAALAGILGWHEETTPR